MPGPAGTVTCMTSPDTELGAFVVDDDQHDAQAAALVRRHGAPAVMRLAAAGLLAVRDRDRADAFDRVTFGLSRSPEGARRRSASSPTAGACRPTPTRRHGGRPTIPALGGPRSPP